MNELELSSNAARNIDTSINDGVLTITMSRPEKLNGWTFLMMEAFKEAFIKAKKNQSIKVIIFTGKGDYYCAGVDLGRSLKLMHPRKLHQSIVEYNQKLFEAFLHLSKPILIAINGPAIGASVTSSTLCCGIIASEKATFSTPFAKLGVPPEGCSSVHFPRLIGAENAQRMLGNEGWKPTASEALSIGLVQWVASDKELLSEANKIAQNWIAQQKERSFLAGSQLNDLKAVNAKESIAVAEAFLSAAFMKEQARFLWSKKKRVPSLIFWSLWLLRPLWTRLL
ncbi:MAG: enoyl-CoA hydratase/isomerase family protein [Kangiellaceae bacterium]|nr:enoyl-CoA hydratase/isomerase family protein [Kangiellaceae bacterium]